MRVRAALRATCVSTEREVQGASITARPYRELEVWRERVRERERVSVCERERVCVCERERVCVCERESVCVRGGGLVGRERESSIRDRDKKKEKIKYFFSFLLIHTHPITKSVQFLSLSPSKMDGSNSNSQQ